jgi:hypothetical protein
MSDALIAQIVLLRQQHDSTTEPLLRAALMQAITTLEDQHRTLLLTTTPEPTSRITQNVQDQAHVGVLIGGDVHGNIIIGDQPVPVPDLLHHVRTALISSHYAEALTICQAIFQQEPRHPLATLYRAIALLSRADIALGLTLRIAQEIEADLIRIISDPALATTAWAVLGVLKIEFDTDQSQDTLKQVSLAQIRKELRTRGIATLDHELWHLLRAKNRTRSRLLD